MRIIKQGKTETILGFRGTCQHCSTEFEFAKREGLEFYIPGHNLGDDIIPTLSCPTCGTRVECEEMYIPATVDER